MKKVLALIFLAAGSSLFATSFFSGETGASANFINNDSRKFDPTLFMDGYFAGQITISNALSVRGEFSLRTPDIYGNGFTKESDSKFRINELSVTLTRSFALATHTLSAFTGHFETAGSQQYISRHLGTKKFSSLLTENWLGQVGSITCPVYGVGGAYSLTLKSIPLSTGLVISRNKENWEGEPQMNADWHLAVAFRYLTMDFLGGVGAPLYTTDANGDKVYLLIDTLYFHTGVDILLGNKYSFFSIFGQYGFEYLPVKSPDKAKDLTPEETYILIEPRFNFGDVQMRITAYSIPKDRIERMPFLDDTLGANLSLYSDTMYAGKRNYTIGLNGTVSFEDKYFNDLEDKDLTDKINIKLAPFTEIEVSGGKLNMMLQVGLSKLIDNKNDAVKFNIGYKKEL